MFRITLLSAIIAHSAVAHALDSFQPNCSLPTEDRRFWYVASPNVRGSWQLVWSCLFTLYVCTYQVVHLNILPADETRSSFRSPFWKTCQWAVVAILAPEFILVDSWAALRQAQRDLKAVSIYWETHRNRLGNSISRSTNNSDTRLENDWTLTHMFYANMGGLVVKCTDMNLTITGNLIPDAVSCHMFEEPPISADDIRDKSKDSSFARIVAIGQILFFCIQFFARLRENLTVTQLELSVVSVTAYSILSYVFLWHKPKAVERSTIIPYNHPSRGLERRFYQKVWSLGTAYMESEHSNQGGTANAIWFVLASMLLGVIHMLGWNLDFPTDADMWLWRASSLMATVFAPFIFWMGINFVLFEHIFVLKNVFLGLTLITMILFLVARLILMVETVRCLFFLPADAFAVASWANSIPHLG